MNTHAALPDKDILDDINLWLHEPSQRDRIKEKFQHHSIQITERLLEYLSVPGSLKGANYSTDDERTKIIRERRKKAINGFRILGDSATPAIPALNALISSNHWDGRIAAGCALAKLGAVAGSLVSDHITRDAVSPSSEIRFTAVTMLRQLAVDETVFAPEETIRLFSAFVNDKNEKVRNNAIFGLGLMRHKHKTAQSILEDLITNRATPDVERSLARQALRQDRRGTLSEAYPPPLPTAQ